MKNVKEGQILAGSWGYSMTLWSFYKVQKVTPKQVVLEECSKVHLGGEMWNERVGLGFPTGKTIRVKNDPNKDYVWVPNIRCLLYEYDANKSYVENHMD